MLSKTRSVKKLATRLALFVPVLALCVYFFNQDIVAKPKIKNPVLNVNSIIKPVETDSKSDKGNRSKGIDFYPVIDIAIDKNQTIYFDNTPMTIDDLSAKIETALKTTLKNINPEEITLRLKVDENLAMGIITDVKDVFRQKGIYKNTINTPQDQKKNRAIIAFAQPNSTPQNQAHNNQSEKVINITVTGSDIYLNGEETTVETFANDLDALSKEWTLSDKRNYSVHVRTSNATNNLWPQLQDAFKTTALYKANPKGLVPPPPPPAPAPPKANSIPAPPPPPAPVNNSSLEAVTVQGLPAPPPPPASPEEMARLADSIYYNDKKITAEKAESLMKESENYNVLFTKTNGKHLLIIKDK